MDTVLLKVPEVMARLGLGHTKVYDLMASGALRSVKVGRSRRIASQEPERFIAQLDDGGTNLRLSEHPPGSRGQREAPVRP
jgi:excisionase family DNA binding protein